MNGAKFVVKAERHRLDHDPGQGGGCGAEAFAEEIETGQAAGVQFGLECLGKLCLAGVIMRQRQQFNGDFAGDFVGSLGYQDIEGPRIGRPGEKLIAIDQVAQRHRLAAQGVDDVAIINDVSMLATGRLRPAAGEAEHVAGAEEALEPVIVEAHAQALTDQPGRHGIEHLAQDEAAGGCDLNEAFLVVDGAVDRQVLESSTFDIDGFTAVGVVAGEELVDKMAIAFQVIKRSCCVLFVCFGRQALVPRPFPIKEFSP